MTPQTVPLESFAALPPESHLEMPVQPVDAPRNRTPLTSSPRRMWLRRGPVIGGALCMTAGASYAMHRVLDVGGVTPLGIVLLVLFVTLFAWIALAFTSALAGFIVMLAGGGKRLEIADGPLPELHDRTALLMPTYNESPARVTAGVQAIHDALVAADRIESFDFFLLSDTTDPDVWIAEEAAFLELRARTGSDARIFYRRRQDNVERKAGNISDWVRRFGNRYRQFLILDADSVMTADAIVRLAAAIERHDDVGLIQTLPVIVNATTMFGRMQQFAGRVYGPIIAQGIAWWHGAESNYWGHNAMIRTIAFARHCGLPHLAGRKPFGGHILSHDFVEAALIRRGGWAVHMVPGLSGSYEEGPPSLTDVAVRDRRWCQGNLQHAALLNAKGLTWVNRLHLLMGIGAYITAPLWLIFLLTGILVSLQARFIRPDYFPAGRSLFPTWPQEDPVLAMWVFGGTMGVLIAPKLFGWLALLADPVARRGCGGMFRAFVSLLIETLFGGLIAPVAMMIQSAGVVSILLGRDSGWSAQRRDDGRVPIRAIARAYFWHTCFGVVLAVCAYAVSPLLVLWMLPVLLGLLLAIPLVAFTGLRSTGLILQRLGLLRTPEEVRPPAVLAAANALQRSIEAKSPERNAVQRLLRDDALLAAHCAMLPAPERQPKHDATLATALSKLDEARDFESGLSTLGSRELAVLLSTRVGIDRLVGNAARP
jgi:membrane glycosyltransferase